MCDIWVYPTHFSETNCHPEGTHVETINGDVAIEKITLSDLVRTKDGNYKRVTTIRSKDINEDIVKIKTQNSEDLFLTVEHPVYAIKCKKEHVGEKLEDIVKEIPEWINAGELNKGDILVSSRKINNKSFIIDLENYIGYRKNNLPTEQNENINTEFTDKKAMWFGYFVGDGHANNRGLIEILVAKAHKDRDFDNVYNGFLDFGLTPDVREEHGYYKIRTYSNVLAKFLKANFYDFDKNKVLPNQLVGNPFVFKGMIYSDGSENKNYNNGNGVSYTFTSKSRKLISQMRVKLNILGYATKIHKRVHKNNCISYYLTWTEVGDKKVNFYQKDENFIYYRIKEIKLTPFQGIVYNIDVENEHNYHANGVVVHNCITALNCQKFGCVPVTINLAALSDTVFSGVKLEGDIYEAETKELFLKELISLAKDEKRLEEEKIKAKAGIDKYYWDNIANEWSKLF